MTESVQVLESDDDRIWVAASEAELLVGNDKVTEWLLTAWSAATLALRS